VLYTLGLQLVISLAVVWFLLARTPVVTGWILRGVASDEKEAAFTTGALSRLALFVAGLIFLISGLETLSLQLSGWLFSSLLRHPGVPIHSPAAERLARMSSSVVRVIAGLWLLLRARKAGRVSEAASN
jgi:hypothetical protein